MFWVAILAAAFFFLTTCFLALMVVGLALGKSMNLETVADRRVSPFTEVTVEGAGANKILLMPVTGIITSQSMGAPWQKTVSLVDSVKLQFDKAQRDSSIKAVVMQVDSPGGTITGSDEIYNRIVRFKKNTRAKVVVIMGTVAASGGYYVSAPAHYVMAHPTTLTGSVGVIMSSINIAEFAKKYGIKDATIKSGAMKDTMSMWRDMRPDERAYLQGIVDEMLDRFVSIVADNRTNLTRQQVVKLADGRVFTGTMALKAGLVDGVGYLEDAIAQAKRLAGIKDARIVRYRRRVSFLDLLEAVGEARTRPAQVYLSFDATRGPLRSQPLYFWSPAPFAQLEAEAK